MRVKLQDGLRQCRLYTLSGDVTSTTTRVFTTKLDEGGEVSPHLHAHVNVGDVIELSNPYGDIELDASDAPTVLATAGIGCTPSASVLQTLAAETSDRQVLVLHAERTEAGWALKEQMRESLASLPNADLTLWLEDTSDAATDLAPRQGFMDLSHVELPSNAKVYLCGPLPFMKAVRSQAIAAGIPATDIHYEVFGPDPWLAA